MVVHLGAVAREAQSPEARTPRVFQNRRIPRRDPRFLEVLPAVVESPSWVVLRMGLHLGAGVLRTRSPGNTFGAQSAAGARAQGRTQARTSSLLLLLTGLREVHHTTHTEVVRVGAP